mmetsp:Transcript_1164/g.3043  ORF Transcript_1164/g.3043 Transcript_1164/m.3043 type:complete len:127 (+) Transcript_1164:380-760(+)
MVTRWVDLTAGNNHLGCDVVALDDVNANLCDLRAAVFTRLSGIIRFYVPLAGACSLYFRGTSGDLGRLDQRVVDEFPVEGDANRHKRHGQDRAHAIPMCIHTNKREGKVWAREVAVALAWGRLVSL